MYGHVNIVKVIICSGLRTMVMDAFLNKISNIVGILVLSAPE